MANLSDRLRAVPDAKARGRLRVAEVVAAHRTAGLAWVGVNGWTFVLDAPPDVHLSARDSQRAAARFDLTVRDGARVVFRDRILAWDGTPVMVPDGTKRVEDGVEVDNFREDPVEGAREDIEHTVRVVTKDGAAPHVKAKPGTVSTFYSGTADGFLEAASNTYSTARAMTSATGNTAATLMDVGQHFLTPTYTCLEGFVAFDTSTLPDTDTVSDATLSLYVGNDSSTTDFTIEARTKDWGASLTSADAVAGASLSSQTRLATASTSGISTAAYTDMTSDGSNLKSAVSLTGTTYMIVASDRQAAGTTPTTLEYVRIYSADEAGSTKDPKLVVTHAAAPTAVGPLIGGKLVGGVLRGRLVR